MCGGQTNCPRHGSLTAGRKLQCLCVQILLRCFMMPRSCFMSPCCISSSLPSLYLLFCVFQAYCRILYLKPRMQIIIRGQNVKSELIAKSLAITRKDSYKPLFLVSYYWWSPSVKLSCFAIWLFFLFSTLGPSWHLFSSTIGAEKACPHHVRLQHQK